MFSLQDSEKERTAQLQKVSIDEILELQRDEKRKKKQDSERNKRAMLDRGLTPQHDPIQEEFL